MCCKYWAGWSLGTMLGNFLKKWKEAENHTTNEVHGCCQGSCAESKLICYVTVIIRAGKELTDTVHVADKLAHFLKQDAAEGPGAAISHATNYWACKGNAAVHSLQQVNKRTLVSTKPIFYEDWCLNVAPRCTVHVGIVVTFSSAQMWEL